MREVLADITRKLEEGAYQNEEHVRLCVVARILHALGWDIWDPNQVFAEFRPIPAEDGTKVDLALFIAHPEAQVFVEVKGVGKIHDLVEAERQLRDYNRNNTALFTVLTDGQYGGSISHKPPANSETSVSRFLLTGARYI